jgi:protein-S-isoprenylcysteine O-methyltransferase
MVSDIWCFGPTLTIVAFLLNNTAQYHYAHAVGLAEYFISSYFFPGKFNSVWSSTPVLVLCE